MVFAIIGIVQGLLMVAVVALFRSIRSLRFDLARAYRYIDRNEALTADLERRHERLSSRMCPASERLTSGETRE